MPDPTIPIHLNLMLQSHILVPMRRYDQLVMLEHCYKTGLLRWADGATPANGLPPQLHQEPTSSLEGDGEAPLQRVEPSAFLRPDGYTPVRADADKVSGPPPEPKSA